MKKMRRYSRMIMTAALACAAMAMTVQADGETIVVEPLFEYVSAPDGLDNLDERSNYLVEHFWDPMDLKSKKPVDQAALNHAFSVYVSPMRWADKDVAVAATDRLLSKLSKNPALLYQFAMAAEENMYGPRADVWIDDIYLMYLKAVVGCKKLPDIRKVRFRRHLDILSAVREGVEAPRFSYEDRSGSRSSFVPDSRYYILEFGDPECDDCRFARLRLESNVALSRLAREDKVRVGYFVVSPSDDSWRKLVADYPHYWTVGAAPEIDDIYDLRVTPSFYIIGPDRKVIRKNISVDEALAFVEALKL